MTQCQLTEFKKVVNTRRGNILYQRIPTPRPPPQVVLKNAWQVQHDKEVQLQPGNEQSYGGGDPFKIDLRVEGVPQNAVFEDHGRVTKIQDLVHTLRTQSQTESVVADLQKTLELNTFSKESQKTFQSLGKV